MLTAKEAIDTLRGEGSPSDVRIHTRDEIKEAIDTLRREFASYTNWAEHSAALDAIAQDLL